MNKKQKLFWDVLSKKYPDKTDRTCENCKHHYEKDRPLDSEYCDPCTTLGPSDYVTYWEWNGKLMDD